MTMIEQRIAEAARTMNTRAKDLEAAKAFKLSRVEAVAANLQRENDAAEARAKREEAVLEIPGGRKFLELRSEFMSQLTPLVEIINKYISDTNSQNLDSVKKSLLSADALDGFDIDPISLEKPITEETLYDVFRQILEKENEISHLFEKMKENRLSRRNMFAIGIAGAIGSLCYSLIDPLANAYLEQGKFKDLEETRAFQKAYFFEKIQKEIKGTLQNFDPRTISFNNIFIVSGLIILATMVLRHREIERFEGTKGKVEGYIEKNKDINEMVADLQKAIEKEDILNAKHISKSIGVIDAEIDRLLALGKGAIKVREIGGTPVVNPRKTTEKPVEKINPVESGGTPEVETISDDGRASHVDIPQGGGNSPKL